VTVFDDDVVSQSDPVLGGCFPAALSDELVDQAHLVPAGFLELAPDALKSSTTTRVPPG
jgi:hypothetical protein